MKIKDNPKECTLDAVISTWNSPFPFEAPAVDIIPH